MSDKKLFLLDAYALIYRSYYAFIRNPRYNTKGLNTSAPFGFLNTLEEILNGEKPSHIAVVFDPGGPTFRNERYKEYKANREAMPEDLRSSIPYIKRLIKAFNIPVIEKAGYEADDVIGTMSKMAEKQGFTVYMMTPDKDYCQLVSENIFMYKPRKSGKDVEIWGIPEVQESFKVQTPDQVIDVLGLMGDSSDNIPGAPGIGEKTAKKLISEYGSIKGVYENIEKLKGKQKENLLNYKEQVELSRELVTICLDVPVVFSEYELIKQTPFYSDLKIILEELEFRSKILNLIPDNIEKDETKSAKQESKKQIIQVPAGDAVQGSLFDDIHFVEAEKKAELDNTDTIDHKYILADSSKKIDNLINQLKELKEFCFDTETTGLDPNYAELVGLSFCFKKHEAYYVPIPAERDKALEIIEKFRCVLEDDNISKIGQNLKYDMLMLRWYGVNIKGKLFDTMIAHYLIQPELRHNLDFLARQYLNYETISIESLIGKKGKNQLSMRNIEIAKVCDYASEDADITFQLKLVLEKELKENNLIKLFDDIEMPLVYVLTEMERNGVRINETELKASGEILRKEIIELEKKIFELTGDEFNISSPKQLGIILFEKLKIDDNTKKTKTKQYSTAEEVLIKLRDRHPVINEILEYRSLKKLLSTYVDALPKMVNQKTGRIHTSYNQARVATGRLSSDNPNLQNIPIREARGREIRRAFIPEEGQIFLSADYSQVELRLMAHMSDDKDLIEAFRNNEDIHQATAAKIFKTDPKNVTREMRNSAKTANFGIIYGISAFGLSQRLNIKRTEAKSLIDSYFESYSGVRKYMDKCISTARDSGYVETLLNRRRYLNDINSRNGTARSMAERNAINAPIQGTAADIIKIAMIRIHDRIQQAKLNSKMILQVHDELNFEVTKQELEKVKAIVGEEMQNAIKLKVPLEVEMGTGDNWLEAH